MSVAAQTSMDIDVPENTRSGLDSIAGAVGIALSGVLLAVAIVGVVYTLLLGSRWYNEPFLGVFTSHTLVVSSIRPISGEAWTGIAAGLRTDDKILAVNDVSFEDVADPGPLFNNTLASLQNGDTVKVKIFRQVSSITTTATCPGAETVFGGANCVYSVPLQHVPLPDFVFEFGIGFVVAVILLAIGALLRIVRRRQPSARLVTIPSAAPPLVVRGPID